MGLSTLAAMAFGGAFYFDGSMLYRARRPLVLASPQQWRDKWAEAWAGGPPPAAAAELAHAGPAVRDARDASGGVSKELTDPCKRPILGY